MTMSFQQRFLRSNDDQTTRSDRLCDAIGRTTQAKRARFPLGLRRIQSNRQAGPAREIARMRRAVFHPEPVPQDAAFANATKPVCFSTAPALWPGGISSPRSVVCCGQSAAKRATSGRLGGGRGGAKKGIVRLGQRNRCGRRWDKADERELGFPRTRSRWCIAGDSTAIMPKNRVLFKIILRIILS